MTAGGFATKDPNPGVLVSKPSLSSSVSARRAVIRLTEKLAARSFSEGTRVPTGQLPEEMWFSIVCLINRKRGNLRLSVIRNQYLMYIPLIPNYRC